MKSHQKVLIIGFVWPEPKSSAAGNRMMQLIALFKEQNWEVTFASAASDSAYMDHFEGYDIVRQSIALNSTDFDTFITKLNPTIVLFDRFMTEEQFGWRVARQLPDALRMLDTEDLHSLRQSRGKAVKERRDFILSDLRLEETSKREIASILRCDVSLVISEFEMQILQDIFHVDKALLHYFPLFAENLKADMLPLFENRKHFVFIGNFLHAPNKDAVKYLKDVVWPPSINSFLKVKCTYMAHILRSRFCNGTNRSSIFLFMAVPMMLQKW